MKILCLLFVLSLTSCSFGVRTSSRSLSAGTGEAEEILSQTAVAIYTLSCMIVNRTPSDESIYRVAYDYGSAVAITPTILLSVAHNFRDINAPRYFVGSDSLRNFLDLIHSVDKPLCTAAGFDQEPLMPLLKSKKTVFAKDIIVNQTYFAIEADSSFMPKMRKEATQPEVDTHAIRYDAHKIDRDIAFIALEELPLGVIPAKLGEVIDQKRFTLVSFGATNCTGLFDAQGLTFRGNRVSANAKALPIVRNEQRSFPNYKTPGGNLDGVLMYWALKHEQEPCPGDSGGPIFDENGKLIALHSQGGQAKFMEKATPGGFGNIIISKNNCDFFKKNNLHMPSCIARYP